MIKQLLFVTALFVCSVAQAQTYTEIGGIVFGSDGTTATTIGNTTFVDKADGSWSTVNRVGNTTFINGQHHFYQWERWKFFYHQPDRGHDHYK